MDIYTRAPHSISCTNVVLKHHFLASKTFITWQMISTNSLLHYWNYGDWEIVIHLLPIGKLEQGDQLVCYHSDENTLVITQAVLAMRGFAKCAQICLFDVTVSLVRCFFRSGSSIENDYTTELFQTLTFFFTLTYYWRMPSNCTKKEEFRSAYSLVLQHISGTHSRTPSITTLWKQPYKLKEV